jgi:hypothetical protein
MVQIYQYCKIHPNIHGVVNTLRMDHNISIIAFSYLDPDITDEIIDTTKCQGFQADISVNGSVAELKELPHPEEIVLVHDAMSIIQDTNYLEFWTVVLLNSSTDNEIDISPEPTHISDSILSLGMNNVNFLIRKLKSLPGIISDINNKLVNGIQPVTGLDKI